MFKYTKAGIRLIVDQFKLFAKICKLGFLLFNICFYIVALAMNLGNRYVNIALLAVISIYGIFDIFFLGRLKKKQKRAVKRSVKWLKFGIRFLGLASAIYGLYLAAESANAITIILTTLSIIWWVIQVFLEIVVEVIQTKADLLIAGWKKDVEDIKKPVTKVSNFFKKVKGEEIPESDIDQSQIDVLDSYIVEEEKKNHKSKKK